MVKTSGGQAETQNCENILLCTSMMIYYALLRRKVEKTPTLLPTLRVCFSNRGFALSSLNFLSFYVAACLFILHPRLEVFYPYLARCGIVGEVDVAREPGERRYKDDK